MTPDRPLRLCFISNPHSIHTRRWLEWFAARGHKVMLIADAPITGEWPGIETFDLASRFNARVIRFAVWAAWVRGLVSRWQPDILHAHRVSSAGWLGAFTGYHPLVVAPWGSDLLQHPDRSRMAAILARYVLRRADWTVVNSNALHKRALQFGANPERIAMIQFGVNRKIFHPGQDSQEWRQRLHLEDGPVLLSCRGVNLIYNIDTVIRAFAKIRDQVPAAKLVLFNYNVNAEYQTELHRLVASLQLESDIRWAGPFSSQEDIARLYALADGIISVPSSDSTPASVLEALACAKPVIVSDLPSLHDWVVDGQNGFFIPMRDENALSEAAVRLLASPDQSRRMGMNGLNIIAERADIDVEMAKMERIYCALLEERANVH